MLDNSLERRPVICIGYDYSSILKDPLESLGFSCFSVPINTFVDKRLQSHIDLSVLKLDSSCVVLSEHLRSTDLESFLLNRGYDIFFITSLGRKYPEDCRLNISIVGKHFFCNLKAVDRFVLESLEASGHIPINVKQGYAGCSICVVDENSIITSDKGIEREAEAYGIDYYHISSDNIQLKGYGNGFIGGSTFTVGNTIYLTGSLSLKNSDAEGLDEFLKERGKHLFVLTELPAFDIGSAIVL